MNIDDYIEQVNKADPHSGRFPFIGDGKHILELADYSAKMSPTKKPILVANLIVVSSNGVHKPDEKVAVLTRLTGHKQPWEADADFARANAFLRAVLGELFLGPNPSLDDLRAAGKLLRSERQPGRGLRVRAEGVTRPQKNDPTKTFTDVSFYEIPGQTKESIAANRKRQELGISVTAVPTTTPAAYVAANGNGHHADPTVSTQPVTTQPNSFLTGLME